MTRASGSGSTGPAILGWDIGGANIKLACLQADDHAGHTGRCLHTVERAFPLWREPAGLTSVLATMASGLRPPSAMALTMTAELADCFPTKREGVAAVIDATVRAFPALPLWVYGVDGRFLPPDEARDRPHTVAAANWMATATWIARDHRDALLLDVGSTTTDIIPIVGGRVEAVGRTDPARLRSGELVYTGCLRTPLCALVRSLPLAGGRCRVAAEHFAIAADAYRWLGQIEEQDYTCDTPDGRGRSRHECGARLARMVCGDSEMLGAADVTAIASAAARAQTRQIAHGLRQVLRRLGPRRPQVAVLAGSGTFIGRAAAESVGLAVSAPSALDGDDRRVAPAIAVAYLLAEQLSEVASNRLIQ